MSVYQFPDQLIFYKEIAQEFVQKRASLDPTGLLGNNSFLETQFPHGKLPRFLKGLFL